MDMAQGVLRALCSVHTLVSGAEPKWCGPGVFWGVLLLCHLGEMVGVVVSADLGCPSVCHAGATLVGQLG